MKSMNCRLYACVVAAAVLLAPACTKQDGEGIKVESISLDEEELTLEEGLQATLHAYVLPEEADAGQILWISGDESVAVVENGVVTALHEGSTKITARTESRMASCLLTVVRPSVTGITLDKETIELRIDESSALTAVVTPDNVRDVVVEWSTDNASVASVTQKGVVTGIGVGSTVITVRASGFTDECTVTVLPVEAESVTLNKAELSMEEGDTEVLVATVGPANTTDKTISWKSSNASVASVSEGRITAVSVGTAVITATCGKATGKCTVTVRPLSSPRYSIGDYYEKDGKKGIVFYITDNGKHGKAVSVHKAPDALWQKQSAFVGASSVSDGKANTEKIRSMEDYPSNYPAFGWFDQNYGEGWYFPSQDEVAEIMKRHSVVWNSSWGYDVLGQWIATSTESSESSYVFLKSNGSGGYSVSQSSKTEAVSEFRAVCEF